MPQYQQYRDQAKDAAALGSAAGFKTAVDAAIFSGAVDQAGLNAALNQNGDEVVEVKGLRVAWNAGDVRLTAKASGVGRFVQLEREAESGRWVCQTVTSLEGGTSVAAEVPSINRCDAD